MKLSVCFNNGPFKTVVYTQLLVKNMKTHLTCSVSCRLSIEKQYIIYCSDLRSKTTLFYSFKTYTRGTSLVAQWLGIHLPTQGTWVRALIRQDPTCRGATKPVRHNSWACALEPASHNYWAHVLQLWKPVCLEPVLHNKRSHRNEKHAYRNEE